MHVANIDKTKSTQNNALYKELISFQAKFKYKYNMIMQQETVSFQNITASHNNELSALFFLHKNIKENLDKPLNNFENLSEKEIKKLKKHYKTFLELAVILFNKINQTYNLF